MVWIMLVDAVTFLVGITAAMGSHAPACRVRTVWKVLWTIFCI